MCIADAGIMICNASYKTTHVHEGKLSGYKTSLRLHCIEVSRPGCPHGLSHVQQHNAKLILFFLRITGHPGTRLRPIQRSLTLPPRQLMSLSLSMRHIHCRRYPLKTSLMINGEMTFHCKTTIAVRHLHVHNVSGCCCHY